MSSTSTTPFRPMRSDWHRVGAGLSVRFSITAAGLDAEWLPRPPTRREWRRVLERYRAARHVLLVALAQARGGDVICLEL